MTTGIFVGKFVGKYKEEEKAHQVVHPNSITYADSRQQDEGGSQLLNRYSQRRKFVTNSSTKLSHFDGFSDE